MSPETTNRPAALEPYLFHRLDLDWRPGDKWARGECLCGHEMGVEISTGKWGCPKCGSKGNSTTWQQLLWEESGKATQDYEDLRLGRGLLYPETLIRWGAARSVLDGTWLLPGYGVRRTITQVYRYVPIKGRMRLIACKGSKQALFGLGLYDPDKPEVWVCEGPWDAMVLWEVLGACRVDDDGKLVRTANPEAARLSSINVVAVPGCNAWNPSWNLLLKDKDVVLLYDNDHPGVHPRTGEPTKPAALAGMHRVVGSLSSGPYRPATLRLLCWGELWYDPARPSGYDVRDLLTGGA